jgi:hypothetical protein
MQTPRVGDAPRVGLQVNENTSVISPKGHMYDNERNWKKLSTMKEMEAIVHNLKLIQEIV